MACARECSRDLPGWPGGTSGSALPGTTVSLWNSTSPPRVQLLTARMIGKDRVTGAASATIRLQNRQTRPGLPERAS